MRGFFILVLICLEDLVTTQSLLVRYIGAVYAVFLNHANFKIRGLQLPKFSNMLAGKFRKSTHYNVPLRIVLGPCYSCS